MRRLTIELPVRQVRSKDLSRALDNIKSYAILHRLKQDESGYVAICRIELKDPDYNVENLAGRTGITQVKSIYRENNGAHIALVTFRPIGLIAEAFRFPGVYSIGPLEIRDEKLKTGFLGKPKRISKFLERMERAKVRYKVLFLGDAKFSPDSPLSNLTDRQRTILLSAYNMGYYDIPRRFDSEQLAKKLNLGRSTVSEHLRKAEHRLVKEAMSH